MIIYDDDKIKRTNGTPFEPREREHEINCGSVALHTEILIRCTRLNRSTEAKLIDGFIPRITPFEKH